MDSKSKSSMSKKSQTFKNYLFGLSQCGDFRIEMSAPRPTPTLASQLQ